MIKSRVSIGGDGSVREDRFELGNIDDAAMSDLELWWSETVADDMARTIPKIQEYGNKDLEAIGAAFAHMQGKTIIQKNAAIYGCMFYALGKLTRAVAALERGDTPSEDTLFDLSIYAMMARSFRERGTL